MLRKGRGVQACTEEVAREMEGRVRGTSNSWPVGQPTPTEHSMGGDGKGDGEDTHEVGWGSEMGLKGVVVGEGGGGGWSSRLVERGRRVDCATLHRHGPVSV